MPPDIDVKMSLNSIVYALGALRFGIDRAEKQRVGWVRDRGGDNRLNDVTENYIYELFSALEDLTKGLRDSGRGSAEVLDRDNRQTYQMLERGRVSLPWTSSRSTGYAFRAAAVRMGLISSEERDRLEALDAECAVLKQEA